MAFIKLFVGKTTRNLRPTWGYAVGISIMAVSPLASGYFLVTLKKISVTVSLFLHKH